MEVLFEKSKLLQSFEGQVTAVVVKVGEDLLVILEGPGSHIGAVSLAEPYIRTNGQTSASVSTLSQHGHRDDATTETFSRVISKETNKTVAVTGGMHIDNITLAQIKDILTTVEDLAKEVAREVRKTLFH